MSEEKLQHDPRTKQYIKDKLYSFIYDPVNRRLKNQLNSIIQKNCTILFASHNSFTYKGIYYSSDNTKPPRVLTSLSKQLYPLMDEYLKEQRQLNTIELPYVIGFITQVLNASDDLQDYLRIFPEAIHQPLEKIIASCPCRNKHLSEDAVLALQNKNKTPIKLMKQRLVINLLS